MLTRGDEVPVANVSSVSVHAFAGSHAHTLMSPFSFKPQHQDHPPNEKTSTTDRINESHEKLCKFRLKVEKKTARCTGACIIQG